MRDLLRGCLPHWFIGHTSSALLDVVKSLPEVAVLMYTFLENKI